MAWASLPAIVNNSPNVIAAGNYSAADIDLSGKTTVTLRSLFDTAEERDRTVKVFGAVEGAKQMLGRLAGHVARIKG